MKYNNNQIKILKHTKKKDRKKGVPLRIPLFPTFKNKREKENPKKPFFLKKTRSHHSTNGNPKTKPKATTTLP